MTKLAMALPLSIAAVMVALAAGFSSGPVGAHADVTPRGNPEREWRNLQGHVIKRLDRNGRLTLYSRDEKSGRIIQIVGMSGTFTSKSVEGFIEGRTAWTHQFEYDDSGRLVAEFDCAEVMHRSEPGSAPKVDERKGTALTAHRHFLP